MVSRIPGSSDGAAIMTSAVGIVLAALASWSLLLVVSRVILTNTGFDPWIFTFLQMMAGGLFLMLVSGRPRGFGPLLLDPGLWLAAGLVGVLLRGPSMFLALKAIHRVKTTNYLAGMAALPLTAILFEAGAASVGWLDPIPVWTWSTAFGVIAILGSLAVIAGRSRVRQAFG